jgi:hypothetical protein
LKQELAFWSSIGPSLSKNWWKQESAPASLRNRPRQTYALVYGLTQANYTDALNTAVELRDLYRAMPWLDQGDDHTMLDACNRLIAKLQSS